MSPVCAVRPQVLSDSGEGVRGDGGERRHDQGPRGLHPRPAQVSIPGLGGGASLSLNHGLARGGGASLSLNHGLAPPLLLDTATGLCLVLLGRGLV